VISDYLDRLAGAISFDRSLSRRVRAEIGDHLHEAVLADPAQDRQEAERRAVAECGDAYAIAAEFAVIALARRARRLGACTILMIAGVFALMKARIFWYAATQWVMSGDMRRVAAVLGPIDIYAFWAAIFLGAAALAYVSLRAVPPDLQRQYRDYLRRFRLFCAAAAGALVISVISDTLLTASRLLTTEAHAAFFIPILSIVFEIICAATLMAMIADLARRISATAALENRCRR
jgi:hypothetical protein